MQVNNQNVGQIPRTFTANCNCCTQPQQPVVAQPQLQPPVSNYQQPISNVPVQPQYNPQYCAPQYAQYPQQQSIPTASTSAVNIQIYNPKVGPENANGNGIGNQYQQPMANGCYPSGYYTGQYGTNGVYYPNMPLPTQNSSNLDQTNGNNANNNGLNTANGATNGINNNGNTQNAASGNENANENKADEKGNNINGQNGNTSSTESSNNGEKSESDKTGVTDGAGNAGAAAATAAQNANNKTDGTGTEKTSDTKTSTEQTDDKKKTEKKKVVELTDTYIKNLENYLDSQEKDIRLNAAKEVYARLAEDETRKDDKALTALINKMLQDPAEEIRLLALSALESRIVTGDDYTTGVLQQMQQSKDGYGQDAIDASKILLQMSGKQVEKEVPVKEKKPEKKETKETKTTTTTETKSEDKKESSKA